MKINSSVIKIGKQLLSQPSGYYGSISQSKEIRQGFRVMRKAPITEKRYLVVFCKN